MFHLHKVSKGFKLIASRMAPAAGWGNGKLTNGQTVSLVRDKKVWRGAAPQCTNSYRY